MAEQLLFDRLVYIDRLKRAGIDDPQARAHAEAMHEALLESVATKADVDRLETMIHSEVTRLETTIQSEVTRLETTIQSEVTRLETTIQSEGARLHSEIARLETKIESETARLETKIELAVRDMTIRMGTIAIALFAALASIKFFG